MGRSLVTVGAAPYRHGNMAFGRSENVVCSSFLLFFTFSSFMYSSRRKDRSYVRTRPSTYEYLGMYSTYLPTWGTCQRSPCIAGTADNVPTNRHNILPQAFNFRLFNPCVFVPGAGKRSLWPNQLIWCSCWRYICMGYFLQAIPCRYEDTLGEYSHLNTASHPRPQAENG